MKLEIFALCDYATGDIAGKMNILGAFDKIQSHTLPVELPLFAIAIKMRFNKTEGGEKAIALKIVRPDGDLVVPKTELKMPFQIPADVSTATAQIVVLVQQLKLPNFGEYSIQLELAENLVGSIPLFAQRADGVPPSP